jgi:hypothetical protein
VAEITFLVEDDPNGGYTAKAIGEAIFAQADSLEELKAFVVDAVNCHFPDSQTRPKLIRLHVVEDKSIDSRPSREMYIANF